MSNAEKLTTSGRATPVAQAETTTSAARPVLWIVNPFDDLPGEGSGPLRFWTLAQTACGLAEEVVWWSSDFSHRRKARRIQPEADLPFSIEMVPTPSYRRNVGPARAWSHLRFARNFHAKAIERVEEQGGRAPTHIIVSSPPLETAGAAFRLRERWGCRVIVDIMDAWPESFLRVLPGPPFVRDRLGRILLGGWFAAAHRAYRGADALAGVSESYLRLAREAGARCRMKLCYHGADIPPRSEAAHRQGPGKVLRVAYIGAMEGAYDLETVICAVAQVVASGIAVEFRLAGGGRKEESLKQLAKDQGLPVVSPGQNVPEGGSAVRFFGYLDRSRLDDFLAGSDLGVVPLLPESWVALPYKVADYAAAGLAVVSGLGGELDTLLEKYGAGWSYPAGEVAALESVLVGCARDRSLLMRRQAASRRMAEELFDRRVTYPDLLNFVLQS
jgi:glycosyltransferase involved in cell wall biosynthesis